jgi:hypothetical protein
MVEGKLLAAPLMQTVDAARSTLKQRLGRVGRTCSGHYVALYRKDSVDPRDAHIEPTTKLFPDDSLRFSLSKQLRLRDTDRVVLDFPGIARGKRIEPLQEEYFRFPELGNKAWADAFFKSLELGCSMDIMLLAAFCMKISPKNRMVIVCIVMFSRIVMFVV